MRRTGAPTLLGLAVIGAAIAWLLQVGLTTGGAPSFIPPVTLYSVLFLLAVGVLLMGRPVRRTTRGTSTRRRVDPFYAMRVLVLAKASSLTGSLLTGVAASLLLYATTRTGTTSVPAFWPDVLTGIGALVLTIAGLVVEWWCRIPPEDGAEMPERTAEQR